MIRCIDENVGALELLLEMNWIYLKKKKKKVCLICGWLIGRNVWGASGYVFDSISFI